MNSPRETLLQRHRKVETQLETIRDQVVRASGRQGTKRSAPEISWRFWVEDFIRLPRGAWGGLAVAWLIIIALNIASSEQQFEPARPFNGRTSSETLQALREQRRLFAELADISSEGTDAPLPRSVPRPRSARKPNIAIA